MGEDPRLSFQLSGPGHLGMALLYQAIAAESNFQFINIAHWRSAEEFTNAHSLSDGAVQCIGLMSNVSRCRIV